ncbi:putative mitochondrial protein AtMg00310 [Primulina tabacum]|uniref:putative mitochondrial protein AtMg00310 n=1 Tax=Primulina tabacum TaxID=48773 RepID=UPI003F5959BB
MADCEAIRNCLLSYERASRQLINFEKSSLSFAPNTDAQLVENIKARLAISMVQGHDIYLGLPVFSTRSKKLKFGYLVERVVRRIQGWGNKTFSAVCIEIEHECSNFWWTVDAGKKRMQWKSWTSLCQPKCMGGMGFCHLETFNKAQLAKKIWRIIVDPGSLVARVLKARYFRHQNIIDAGLGSNPSYLWRSLLWSRPLLDKGLCWHVGDGAKIAVKGDRWIPSSRGSATLAERQDNHLVVKDLIENGSWKE